MLVYRTQALTTAQERSYVMKKSVNLFISIFMTCLLLFGLSTTSFAVEYSGDEATEIIPVLHVNLDTQEETLFNFTYNPSDNSTTITPLYLTDHLSTAQVRIASLVLMIGYQLRTPLPALIMESLI